MWQISHFFLGKMPWLLFGQNEKGPAAVAAGPFPCVVSAVLFMRDESANVIPDVSEHSLTPGNDFGPAEKSASKGHFIVLFVNQ